MKVLWIVNIVMPEFAKAIGESATNYGGWMPSLLESLRTFHPETELLVVSEGVPTARVKVRGVFYQKFGRLHGRFSRKLRGNVLGNLHAIIADFRPDVIHIHGTEYGYAALPVHCWCGVPVVVSLQGVLSGLVPHFLGEIAESELQKYESWLQRIVPGHSVHGDIARWYRNAEEYEMRALSNIKYIMGRTDWDRLWASALAPHATYMHVGEVLRPAFYEEPKRKTHKDFIIYASAAAAYPLKGAHILLKALDVLRRKYPFVRVRIADAKSQLRVCKEILGRFHQKPYHRYLRAMIDKYNLWPHVDLLPPLTAQEVRDELLNADVFCLPSFCENSPNSMLEAMITETPVVTSCAGGIPTLAEQGVSLLVTPGDPVVLADALERAVLDKIGNRRQLHGQWKRVCALTAPSTIVAQLMQAYQAVILNGGE